MFLRREREAPKHKDMVEHWTQMRTAATTLASLAKGGGVTGDP